MMARVTILTEIYNGLYYVHMAELSPLDGKMLTVVGGGRGWGEKIVQTGYEQYKS